jgi:hypothetical protein
MFKKVLAAFGLDQPDEGEVTQVINLYDAVLAHKAWKKRLLDYLENRSKEVLYPEKICVDNLCVLGKWIHSDGKVRFGEQPAFIKLVDEHAKFHHYAGQVVEAHQAGATILAQTILTGEFDDQSRRTVNCLAKLNALVESENSGSETH